MKPEYKKKDIRSFVLRAGRMTAGQKKAFDRWWPQYGLSLFDGPIDLEAAFAAKSPVVIEVGFGMGDSLFQMARTESDKNFIGIEVHPPGVGRLINRCGEQGMQNLRVYMADALDVLNDCISTASVSRFQLYFPDPWHKKKHHKRRLVQAPFLDLLAEKLVADGIFHVATDWEDYAEHIMALLCADSRFDNLAPEYQFSERPDYRPHTKFEGRGERLGHDVWDIIFRKRG